jgi:hypothetical protein
VNSGELANLDTNARLIVPVGVLRFVSWWADTTADVMAELVQEGHVRIYSFAQTEPKVTLLRREVLELPPEERFEALATITDRYRKLRLYGDGRLGLTKDVAQILGFRLKIDKPTFFTQAFTDGFEVLSLQFRLRRLELNKRYSIGTHLSEQSGSSS